MEIKTKYKLGDELVAIIRRQKKTFIKCKICLGEGKITAKGSGLMVGCPKCSGKGGSLEWLPKRWAIEYENLIVKQIRLGNLEGWNNPLAEPTESYACTEAGFDYSVIYQAKDLFRYIEDAQEECDKRNKEDE